jgi:hypothetical protein
MKNMVTYLQDRKHYEARYDKSTVEACRTNEALVNGAFNKIEKDLPASELQEKQTAWYVQYSALYFQLVELLSVTRYATRDKAIKQWMDDDSMKDEQLKTAQLIKKPYCLNCGKGMREFSRTYLHRELNKQPTSNDDILVRHPWTSQGLNE